MPDELVPSVFPVGAIELSYTEPHPDQPPLDTLLPIEVELLETERGWAAPRADQAGEIVAVGGPSGPTLRLEPSGLARVMRAIVARLNATGLYGIDVRPAASEIDPESERDLRPAGRSALRVEVSVGRVSKVRTIAVGDRVRGDWKIDNALHTRIRRESPIQATGVVDGDETDLLDRERLEDYLYRLNRHPGRRVEAALAPGSDPGDIVLDYRVLESKPWYVYGQVANTGTDRSSPWQTRLGFTHRQLTNRDDILSIEYLNAGGDDVNGVRARYQAPFFGPERPDWMNRRKGDPAWLDWIPRDDLPWWGVDRLRWEVDFGWGRADANRSSTLQGIANDPVTSRQFNYGGRFIYETLQFDDFFVDLWGGLRLRDVNVRNKVGTGSSSGDALFVIPVGGLHAERINQISSLGLDIGVQGSVSDISEQELDGLGRDSTDDRFAIIDFNLGYSTFLEPLFRPAAWRDPASRASSTLAHEIALGVRGQYAFDYRLVPQASQTLGGLFSVRGYDQSVAVGDTIVVGSLEYRFHLPRALPVVREPLRIPYVGDFRVAPQQPYGRPDWDLVLRAFVDAGRAIRNDRSSTNAGVNEYNQTLVGAGVGAELLFRSNFRARIDWATALKDTNGSIANPAEVGDSEIYVLFSILY